jgi:hypothetical protein
MLKEEKEMIIDKEIISKVPRDYIFVAGIFNIDSKYFKKRVDEGVQHSNINYKTNVHGKHTAWHFFNKDKEFLTLLLKIIDGLESLNIELEKFTLAESWGLIEAFGGYTQRHNHGPYYLSGVIYLNDHHQKVYFPEIKQEITPKKGRFVVFSSFLMHQTKRNLKHQDKYAISFNLRSVNDAEK